MTLPRGTDVTALAPTYTVSPGATGRPASGTPLDFNTPQVYTVTAPDRSTKEYRVAVRFAADLRFQRRHAPGLAQPRLG